MRLHRFLGDFDFEEGVLEVEDAKQVRQIKKVLRLEVGSRLILANGKMKEALCVIEEVGRIGIRVRVEEVQDNKNETPYYCVLYCALLKKENFGLVVEKATEVGIKEIVPFVSRRTVKIGFNGVRLRKIAREAVEQSGRGQVPVIQSPFKLDEIFESSYRNSVNVFFDVMGKPMPLKDINPEKGSRVGLFIGPEGGWEEKEIDRARMKDFVITSLGSLTLRAETAAIITSYIAAYGILFGKSCVSDRL